MSNTRASSKSFTPFAKMPARDWENFISTFKMKLKNLIKEKEENRKANSRSETF